jgi:hypothetical protein
VAPIRLPSAASHLKPGEELTPDFRGFAHLILGCHIPTFRVVIEVMTTKAGGTTMQDGVACASAFVTSSPTPTGSADST